MFTALFKDWLDKRRVTCERQASEKQPLASSDVELPESEGTLWRSSRLNSHNARLYLWISAIINIALTIALLAIFLFGRPDGVGLSKHHTHHAIHPAAHQATPHNQPLATTDEHEQYPGHHLRYDDHRYVNASLFSTDDSTWEAYFRSIGKLEERPDGSAIVTNQFHALHCSNLLRRISADLGAFDDTDSEQGITRTEAQCWSDWDPAHLSHCAEMLGYYVSGPGATAKDRVLIVPKTKSDCVNGPRWKVRRLPSD